MPEDRNFLLIAQSSSSFLPSLIPAKFNGHDLLNLITQRKQAKLIYLAEKIPNLPSKKNALNYSWPNGYKKQYLFRGCLYCKGGGNLH